VNKIESRASALTATLERPESMMLAEHLKKTGEGALAELKPTERASASRTQCTEFKPKAEKISDDELDDVFRCAFVKPPVQHVNAEAEEAADTAARKRTVDAIMASTTFHEMCEVIASGPPPKRWQAACWHRIDAEAQWQAHGSRCDH